MAPWAGLNSSLASRLAPLVQEAGGCMTVEASPVTVGDEVAGFDVCHPDLPGESQ